MSKTTLVAIGTIQGGPDQFGKGKSTVNDGESFSVDERFRGARAAFLSFAADFLRKIAEMILQQTILNALQKSTGASGAAGAIASALAFHTGGIVGRVGTRRDIAPMLFATAQRFHRGGLPGIASNEVPAILKKGEEVLTENDPRHTLNGGAAPLGVKIINTIDSASVVEQGVSTSVGERAILNVIRANRSALRQVLT